MIIICNVFRTFLLARLSIFIIFYAKPLFYANSPSYSPSYANPNSSASYSTSSIPHFSRPFLPLPQSPLLPPSLIQSRSLSWRCLDQLCVLARSGATWFCYSSWLILAMIRSVICPGRTWHCFVRCHATDIIQHSTFETICLRHSQSVTPSSLM